MVGDTSLSIQRCQVTCAPYQISTAANAMASTSVARSSHSWARGPSRSITMVARIWMFSRSPRPTAMSVLHTTRYVTTSSEKLIGRENR